MLGSPSPRSLWSCWVCHQESPCSCNKDTLHSCSACWETQSTLLQTPHTSTGELETQFKALFLSRISVSTVKQAASRLLTLKTGILPKVTTFTPDSSHVSSKGSAYVAHLPNKLWKVSHVHVRALGHRKLEINDFINILMLKPAVGQITMKLQKNLLSHMTKGHMTKAWPFKLTNLETQRLNVSGAHSEA